MSNSQFQRPGPFALDLTFPVELSRLAPVAVDGPMGLGQLLAIVEIAPKVNPEASRDTRNSTKFRPSIAAFYWQAFEETLRVGHDGSTPVLLHDGT